LGHFAFLKTPFPSNRELNREAGSADWELVGKILIACFNTVAHDQVEKGFLAFHIKIESSGATPASLEHQPFEFEGSPFVKGQRGTFNDLEIRSSVPFRFMAPFYN